ncbi:AraC family transcriptional regulator [Pseudolabrys sp. Root1462]|uniref:SDR family NAD(P)-dependent oxidoreductase n=1 Tax=Pseudolabrys sp. Root1462 TaxID=1736466 RepID=UPI0007027A2E|nr:SDR family oxidoreductase [Pseudolabrys sp. Root1462]KQZ01321.1 AraC family transcriptional regulator [Pseudolabrys sp. Root1462]
MAQAVQPKSTVLITGASSGIGATYADRFAKRGHNLVLVARDAARLNALATRLRTATGVKVDVLPTDLSVTADLAKVEKRLRDDAAIGILVNNAGMAAPGGFADGDPDIMEALIKVNVTAVTRLAAAAVKRFLAQGKGDIINIASVLGLAPEIGLGAYSASKSFVLTLSQSLNAELGSRGLYVQAVLPAATRTEIWERSGRDVNKLAGVMDVGELVDAALAGFDRRETVTIPPLPDAAQWEAFNAARQAMLPNFANERAAPRYRAAS